jgi:L-ascorbate metabolism protein UlaG (beta-lactamase superfamily)
MKRRQLIRYASLSSIAALASIGFNSNNSSLAQTSSAVTIQYLGHTCFLFTSSDLKILVNPFRPAGCTAGYRAPKVDADVILVSSFLLDEGAVDDVAGDPRILTETGDYTIGNIKFQGISTPHDRQGGKRFGKNIVWRWNQAGVNILHLGGAAAPIDIEQKILMGSPDILFVPVGGGVKAYNPQEAKSAIEVLKPRVVIPTQYLTSAADKQKCDLTSVDDFLALSTDWEIKKLTTNSIAIKPTDLPETGTLIRVLQYS